MIEFLLVIANLAILMSLVAFVLRGTNAAAERTCTISHMRQAATGIFQYARDHGECIPNGDLGTKQDGTGGNRGLI